MTDTFKKTQGAAKEAVEAQARATETAAKETEKAATAALNGDPMQGLDVAVPEAVRSLAEKTVTQSREAYERAKDAMEDTVETLEKSLDKAGQGATALNRKAIDIAQANVNSTFDLAKDIAAAKNVAEIVELQTAFARKQFERLTAQAEEIRSLSMKLATDAAEPFRAHVSRSIEATRRAS